MNTSMTTPHELAQRAVEPHKLSELALDSQNPRFGGLNNDADQATVVAFIVEQFGIEDVLASLATNGYFHSEPLVAKRTSDGLVVVEGNRRLAACLILAGDSRASKVAGRQPIHVSQVWNSDTEVPVLVFNDDETEALLPYLGVRHIVGSQPWDSYAKARWIDTVVSTNQMSLEEIESAIGDTNRTIARMLDGYRFVTQLLDSSHFKPEHSQRRGRGSNAKYPFSWIYTLLDYSQVREYLELSPRSATVKKPIPAKHLVRAATTVSYMFGDEDKPPVIRNSRQIRDLADALGDPVKRDMLAQGRSIDDVIKSSRPATDRLATLLRECQDGLTNASGLVAGGELSQSEADKFQAPAHAIRNLAKGLFEQIQNAAFPGDGDGDS